MYITTLVTQPSELEQIAMLSKENLKTGLSNYEQQQEGFITWEYSLDLLQKMHEIAPSIIVKWGNEVAGYALTALAITAEVHPNLQAMLNSLRPLTYRGIPLHEYRYYVMGQVCIAKAHRGKGLFDRLYQHHRTVYGKSYDLLVTEVSTANQRSMRVHEKTGFETIHSYRDALDEWNVVVWYWK